MGIEVSIFAAKYGIVGLTKAAALEYASQCIRVTAIGPGYVETPKVRELPEEVRAQMSASHPLGRSVPPSSLAAST